LLFFEFCLELIFALLLLTKDVLYLLSHSSIFNFNLTFTHVLGGRALPTAKEPRLIFETFRRCSSL
jgi:hypothetical protein